MNTRRKGLAAEEECKKLLEGAGWTVQRAPTSRMWNQCVDFFNLFDIIAVKGSYIKFVQVKCNKKPSLKKYEEFSKEHESVYDMQGNPYISYEVWVRIDGKPSSQRWLTYCINTSDST